MTTSRLSQRILSVFFVCALIGTLGGCSTYAQFGRNKVQYDRFDFRRIESEHFDIYGYPEEGQAVRDAARMAERWYRRHSAVFNHELTARRPLFFYANDADFQQTNIVEGPIDQGTGGVTTGLKQRVVMPFTGAYADTDHVLGHELVHSFQFDLAFSMPSGINLRNLPLWLVEGMAEYFSIGRVDPHTAMWLRDAALRDDLPTIRELSTGRFFPYRFGQAYMAYVGGVYGDGAVSDLFRMAGRAGVEAAVQNIVGTSADTLSAEWAQAVKEIYLPLAEDRTPAGEAGQRIVGGTQGRGGTNVAPAISPDGRYVAFLSSRDLFSLNLYVANAETGEIVKRLRTAAGNPHFDALRFMNSAGTWSPDGRRLAFVTFAKGRNEIAIWNVQSGSITDRFAVRGVKALAQPAWSPDGSKLAFSGLDGGLSDLYVLDLSTKDVRQLTGDRFADLQPAWAPDGTRLAFTTDRGPDGTNFQSLTYAEERIGLFDLETGEIEVLRPFETGMHHNPKFTPDGRGLYFISDHDGFKDVYRVALATSEVSRVTRLQTGVSSFTPLAPAMDVATQSGRMVFSVFRDNEYTLFGIDDPQAQTTPMSRPFRSDTLRATAGTLPPVSAVGSGLVASSLAQPLDGLPASAPLVEERYRPRFQLDYIAPPTLGVAAGGGFGTQIAGSVGAYFSDLLGNQHLGIELMANGTIKDVGGQATYLNRGHRLNYGIQVGHIPRVFGSAFTDVATNPETGRVTRRFNEIRQRVIADQVSAITSYPLSTTRRLEASTGVVRYGFDNELRQVFLDQGRELTTPLPEPDAIYLSQTGLAYVEDFSFFGFTSPVQGGRYRLQVTPTVGEASYVSILTDVRRYVRTGPITFAGRLLHVGNYGAEQGELFSSEYLGYTLAPGFMRGYSFNSFSRDECTGINGECPALERLQGTRIAMTSAEVRIPVFGTPQYGLFSFPFVPTELSAFADAGLAWSAEEAPVIKWNARTDDRVPVVSTGVSARFNLLGMAIIEVYYAVPFQRPDEGGVWGLQLAPGW